MKNKLIYLAGILDGEGWFSVQKATGKRKHPSYMPVIGVANTDKRLMEWLHSNFGGAIRERQPNNGISKRLRYEWVLNTTQTVALLPKAIPFLFLKKEQAKLLLKLKKLHSTSFRMKGVPQKNLIERENLYIKIRTLNHSL